MGVGGTVGKDSIREVGEPGSDQMLSRQHTGSGPCKCDHVHSLHFLSVLGSWGEAGVFIFIC